MASLNNRSGRVGWLEAALRALQKGNVDVGFLQETKLKQGIHTRHGWDMLYGKQMRRVDIREE